MKNPLAPYPHPGDEEGEQGDEEGEQGDESSQMKNRGKNSGESSQMKDEEGEQGDEEGEQGDEEAVRSNRRWRGEDEDSPAKKASAARKALTEKDGVRKGRAWRE